MEHTKSLTDVLATYTGKPTELVAILLDLQDNFGYLPGDAIKAVADFLKISEGSIYSVATFYTQFRFTPLGRKRVTVCRGTACHIRGAPSILGEIEHTIGIKEGETSADREYSLETVACIGCCALAPCVKVGEDVHGDMSREKVKGLLKGETHAR